MAKRSKCEHCPKSHQTEAAGRECKRRATLDSDLDRARVADRKERPAEPAECKFCNSPEPATGIPCTRCVSIKAMAKEQHEKDGELEIDESAKVSEGEDNGAYVQSWVWVDFAGTKLCKGDGGKHEDCSDGCPIWDKSVEEGS